MSQDSLKEREARRMALRANLSDSSIARLCRKLSMALLLAHCVLYGCTDGAQEQSSLTKGHRDAGVASLGPSAGPVFEGTPIGHWSRTLPMATESERIRALCVDTAIVKVPIQIPGGIYIPGRSMEWGSREAFLRLTRKRAAEIVSLIDAAATNFAEIPQNAHEEVAKFYLCAAYASGAMPLAEIQLFESDVAVVRSSTGVVMGAFYAPMLRPPILTAILDAKDPNMFDRAGQ